MKHKTRS